MLKNRNRPRTLTAAIAVMLAASSCGSTQDVSTPIAPEGVSQEQAAPTQETPAADASTTTPLSDTAIATAGNEVPQYGSIKIDTKVYENSVYSALNCRAGTVWDFDLNRGYSKLNAIVGVDDHASSTDKVTVKLTADGAVIRQADVSLGKATDLEVPTAGALRLTVEITRSGGKCDATNGASSYIAFGNARLTK